VLANRRLHLYNHFASKYNTSSLLLCLSSWSLACKTALLRQHPMCQWSMTCHSLSTAENWHFSRVWCWWSLHPMLQSKIRFRHCLTSIGMVLLFRHQTDTESCRRHCAELSPTNACLMHLRRSAVADTWTAAYHTSCWRYRRSRGALPSQRRRSPDVSVVAVEGLNW
jgi:hypothetical protein